VGRRAALEPFLGCHAVGPRGGVPARARRSIASATENRAPN